MSKLSDFSSKAFAFARRYVFNWWVGLDQWVNTWLAGDPDMTLSGRMGRDIAAGRCKYICRPICWVLDKIQKDHCQRSNRAEKDEGKDALVSE